MMTDVARCTVCGEPMPEGETMFKYHGFSGPCPKPPLPKPVLKSAIRYFFREANGLWLDVEVDGQKHDSVGPFATEAERQCAFDDLMAMMKSTGSVDGRLQ